MVELTDLAIYGAAAELGWYAVKGYVLKELAKIRPLYKSEKIIGVLPYPLDYMYDFYEHPKERIESLCNFLQRPVMH